MIMCLWTTGQYHDMKDDNRLSSGSQSHERSALVNDVSNAPDSAFYSEITDDPNAYLEPRCTHNTYDCIDDVNDFSNIEGSVCNTDYFDQMCASPSKPATAAAAAAATSPSGIDVDKYKIKPPVPAPRHSLRHGAPQAERGRLSAILQEGDLDDSELGDDTADLTLDAKRRPPANNAQLTLASMDDDDVIEVLSDDSVDSLKKRRLPSSSDDSGNTSPALNDLDRLSLSSQEDHDDDDVMTSPNIVKQAAGGGGGAAAGAQQSDYGDCLRANASDSASSSSGSSSTSHNASGDSLRCGHAAAASDGGVRDDANYDTMPSFDNTVNKLRLALESRSDKTIERLCREQTGVALL